MLLIGVRVGTILCTPRPTTTLLTLTCLAAQPDHPSHLLLALQNGKRRKKKQALTIFFLTVSPFEYLKAL